MCKHKRPKIERNDMRAVNFMIGARWSKGILLQDCSFLGGSSITNAASEILWYLYEMGRISCLTEVFYVDSDSKIDELVHDCGKFIKFRVMSMSIEEFLSVYRIRESEIFASPQITTINKEDYLS